MKPAIKPRKKPMQERSRFMVDTILEAAARVLIERGYAGINTNLVAEVAGVSIGSLYQYFPNKDSLIAAIHQRHVLQMRNMMIGALSGPKKPTMKEAIGALVRVMLEAHLMEPELHQVLEIEFPLLGLQDEENSSGQYFSERFQQLLEDYRHEILKPDLELASYIVLRIIKSLVHQAVLETPPDFTLSEIEESITEAVVGYLTIPVFGGSTISH
jgi:AcrR family transcriptional regulator